METYDELVASRRSWIDQTLIPWCRKARRQELLKAQAEWQDLAGRVSADASLWCWAWSRFPDLVSEGLAGLDETFEVTVTTTAEGILTGYPDARNSSRGRLVLIDAAGCASEAISIDDVTSVTRA